MRQKSSHFFLTFVTLPVVLISAMAIYMHFMSENFEAESMNSLEEVSEQSVNVINTEIMSKEDLLQDLSTTVTVDFTQNSETVSKSIRSQLSSVVKNHDFYNMGIVDDYGNVYITDGTITTKDDLAYFDSLKSGQTNISGRIDSGDADGKYINVYSSPIYDKMTYRQKATIYATYETDNFRDTMAITSFNGAGYSYMVTSSGDVVVDSTHEGSFENLQNIYDSMISVDASNEKSVEELTTILEAGESGCVTFMNAGVKKYMYATPVGVNDWYLLTVVPVAVVNQEMRRVTYGTLLMGLLFIASYTILLGIVARQHQIRQEELSKLAYVDTLTGGFTLAKFKKEFERITKSHPNENYVLVNLDLSKFKMINDLYGYDEGDKIIIAMEKFWQERLRENEICAHRMADRFVVLLRADSREEIEDRLEEYRDVLQNSTEGKYKLNLNVGIYEIKDLSVNFDTMFSRSMMAFGEAKNNPSKFYAFYDEVMEEGLVWEQYVEDYFQTAMENHEFKVYYQAKVSTENAKISGAEALVRWIRPDGTVISPGRFVPVLENNGMIAELDRYMFKQVLEDQKNWLEQGHNVVPVSVNLSRVQLAEFNFVDKYKKMLEESGLDSKYISLEFTESAMFDNEEILKDTVTQLHGLGIKVLIDDFGVGFSSMMTLKTIPVDIMKMDKSFIDSIGDERGNKIVVGLIEFALSLGMSVTAEGVEHEEQYLFLKQHRCNDIQGYYFARPVPGDEYCNRFLKSA